MYFDALTLAGLLSAISVAGILHGMACKDISRGCPSLKVTCCRPSAAE